jgi:hypothetical protein
MDDVHTHFRSITRACQVAAGCRCIRALAIGSLLVLALSACRDRRHATEGKGLLPPPPAGNLVPAGPQPRTPYEKVGDATFARTIFQTAGPSETAISIRDVVVSPRAEGHLDATSGPSILDLLSGKGSVTAGDKTSDLDLQSPLTVAAQTAITLKNGGDTPLVVRLYITEGK